MKNTEWAKLQEQFKIARAEIEQSTDDPHLRARLVALDRLLQDTADEVRRAQYAVTIDSAAHLCYSFGQEGRSE